VSRTIGPQGPRHHQGSSSAELDERLPRRSGVSTTLEKGPPCADQEMRGQAP